MDREKMDEILDRIQKLANTYPEEMVAFLPENALKLCAYVRELEAEREAESEMLRQLKWVLTMDGKVVVATRTEYRARAVESLGKGGTPGEHKFEVVPMADALKKILSESAARAAKGDK